MQTNVAREDDANRQVLVRIVAPIVVHVRRPAIVAVPASHAVTNTIVLKFVRRTARSPADDKQFS